LPVASRQPWAAKDQVIPDQTRRGAKCGKMKPSARSTRPRRFFSRERPSRMDARR